MSSSSPSSSSSSSTRLQRRPKSKYSTLSTIASSRNINHNSATTICNSNKQLTNTLSILQKSSLTPSFLISLPISNSNTTRQCSWLPSIHPIFPRQHHFLCTFRLTRRPRTPSFPVVAVQARTVPSSFGDSGGEVSENVLSTTQKSFSVGLTIVSGFDPALRRSVIEKIVANGDAGRVVVVTTGGITSTDETDGLVPSNNSDSTTEDTENDKDDNSDQTASNSSTDEVTSASEPDQTDIEDDTSNADTAPNNETIDTTTVAAMIENFDRNNKRKQKAENIIESINDENISLSVSNLEGWISCSSSEEMVEVVLKLATSRECDYILAESALDANMEPQILAQTLHARGGALLRVDTLVSVLDGETFLNDLLASPSTLDASSEQIETETYNSSIPESEYIDETTTNSESTPSNNEDVNATTTSASVSESWRIQELSQQRPMILVSLVEHANVIVVTTPQSKENRSDQLSRIQDVVSVLNGNASIVPSIEDNLPVDQLINTNSYDNDVIQFNPTWMKVLRASRPSPPTNSASIPGGVNGVNGAEQKKSLIPGINVGGNNNNNSNNNNNNGNSNGNDNTNNTTDNKGERSSNGANKVNGSTVMSTIKSVSLSKSLKEATFLYKAKRPFHPARLYEHIKDVATFAGVIRSTGRIWLATRMLAPLEWNQAGVAATLKAGKMFWAALPESDWPTEEEERKRIMAEWDTRYGDRETEIVFVGIGIDKVRLQGLLDGCLLQDEEMVFNNLWENFEDPFVQWVPLIEEEEEEEEVVPVANTIVEPEPEPEPEPELKSEPEPEPEPESKTEVGSDPQKETKTEIKSELPTANTIQEDKIEEQEKKSENEGAQTVVQPEIKADPKETVKKTTNRESELAKTGEDFIEDVEVRVNELDGGALDDEDIPEDLMVEISAMDVLNQGLSNGSTNLVPQQEDDGLFDHDDAIIASWDGSVADGILTKIPPTGLPITLVTGFLGSGKTTLMNYILTADHGLKIAVLVNEFGEIDIDNQLIQNANWDADGFVELSNGCICCDINDSFILAMENLLKLKDDIDYVIIETTGVADPGPIINSLMATELADELRLDGVLTLVDAENFDVETHMNSEAALSQIMSADTILLSKTDIAVEKKVTEVIEFIRKYRPAARILRSQRGRVPIDLILDVGLRVSESQGHINPEAEKTIEHTHNHDEHKSEHNHDHDHNHNHDHECESDCSHESHSHSSNHLEADGFVTTSFKSDRPLDTQLFMDNFLRTLPEGVFRAKGLLYFYGFSERYVFQLSGRRYHMQMDAWPEGEAPGNQLVIIGRDLDIQSLKDTLETCHAYIPEEQ